MTRLQAVRRGLAVILVPLSCAIVMAQSADKPAPEAGTEAATAPEPAAPSDVERGKYLADAGNCFSCHTREEGEPFAGGVSFETPFGTIYSTNITPDPETGIGNWSAQDLRRAMHEGVAPGGRRLFPAFPYPSYTKVTDEDVDAIYAYLRTLKPVRYTPPDNSFLFWQRWPLMIWNAIFFEPGRFVPDPSQSAEWNRGAYLTEGLGHCGACHTPRNVFMAEVAGEAYRGGVMLDKVAEDKVRHWSAVNLTSAKNGLAAWKVEELTRYLHSGFSMRAGTFGPMNEVIVNSLMKLTEEDARAMAVYLKSLPPRGEYAGEGVPAELVAAGAPIYEDRCEECHSESGRGGLFSGPPLAGSAIVQAEDPSSLINIILYGPTMPKEVSFGAWETMKAYGDVLDDEQVAAVANYIRGSWDNLAPPVTSEQVARQR